MERDAADTGAFFFNSIAEEIERILRESREQEQRLTLAVEQFSGALTRLAAGDFDVELKRDFRGDSIDVLAFLVNNMAAELRQLVAERERAARERESELARLVDERTARLQESEESFRRLFEAAPVPMVLIGVREGVVQAANERAAAVLNRGREGLVGAPAVSFFEEAGEWRRLVKLIEENGAFDAVSTRLLPPSGQPLWCLVSARPVSLGQEATLMASFQDISEQKRVEERLRDLATKDSLTEVLNRRRFFEIADEELARVDRYGGEVAVALLDLDHFKSVNDRFGHAAGDEALRRVASTVVATTRRQDHVARYGGEEFVVLLPETSLKGAAAIAERIRSGVAKIDLRHDAEQVPLGVSVGVALRGPGEALLAVLGRADNALYRAKDRGRNRVELA
jgi:diguanylate cyclase (GGDEF)-like protein/PAS domain S-box-containing protein